MYLMQQDIGRQIITGRCNFASGSVAGVPMHPSCASAFLPSLLSSFKADDREEYVSTSSEGTNGKWEDPSLNHELASSLAQRKQLFLLGMVN
jgi:hypothetical protein